MVTGAEPTILHADLDAFYASVALLERPELRGRPVAAGGGVVLSATYEARRFGVESGMPIRAARRLCPGLVVVGGEFERYVELSEQVFSVFRDHTPQVEALSIDEAFLEISGATHLFGEAEAIARRIRELVLRRTGLVVSVGGAGTKFLAKVASRVAKPDGMVIVARGAELDFLQPLSVDHLWGVGPVTLGKLAERGIRTVGDLAHTRPRALADWLGRGAAAHLHALAWNRDPRGVVPTRSAKSVGAQSTFGRDERDPRTFARVLIRLADRVGARLRKKGRAGRTITVRVRFSDFTDVTRAHTMATPSASSAVLFRVGRRLVSEVRTGEPGRGVRLLGISVSKLQPASPLQLELPMDLDGYLGGHPRELELQALDAALDEARDRFGRESIGHGSSLLGPRHRFSDGLSDLMTREH